MKGIGSMVELKQTNVSGHPDGVRMVYRFQNDPVDGREFELVVSTWSPVANGQTSHLEHPLIIAETETDELSIIVARTMRNWVDVMKAIIFDTPLSDDRVPGNMAIRKDENEPALSGVPESEGHPYCTVWNVTNFYHPGLSVVVHSWDDGTHAYNTAMSHIKAVRTFNKYASHFGVLAVGVEPPRQNTQQTPPQQMTTSIGTSDNPIGRNADSDPAPTQTSVTLRPYVRSTKKGLAAGLLAIETGKAASPNFGTNAMIANTPYDYKNIQFDTGVYVAYALNGAITINSYKNEDGSVAISANIPVLPSGNIRIFDKGGEHNYDWSSLAQSLGVPKVGDSQSVGLRECVGQSLSVQADFVVMKVSGSADKKFINFFGLYHAPQETQQKLADNFPM
jgi:hypothetical protein